MESFVAQRDTVFCERFPIDQSRFGCSLRHFCEEALIGFSLARPYWNKRSGALRMTNFYGTLSRLLVSFHKSLRMICKCVSGTHPTRHAINHALRTATRYTYSNSAAEAWRNTEKWASCSNEFQDALVVVFASQADRQAVQCRLSYELPYLKRVRALL